MSETPTFACNKVGTDEEKVTRSRLFIWEEYRQRKGGARVIKGWKRKKKRNRASNSVKNKDGEDMLRARAGTPAAVVMLTCRHKPTGSPLGRAHRSLHQACP